MICRDPFPPTGQLLTVDPSIASPGAACFSGGRLVWAGFLKIPKTDDDALDRAEQAARELVDHALDRVGWISPDQVVVEFQEHYRGSRVNVNELFKLTAMAGAAVSVACALAYEIGVARPPVKGPRPRDWCGTLPKCKSGSYWKSPRGARVKSRLSDAEFALVPDQPDAGDAVGLGLWSLNRWQRAQQWIR